MFSITNKLSLYLEHGYDDGSYSGVGCCTNLVIDSLFCNHACMHVIK